MSQPPTNVPRLPLRPGPSRRQVLGVVLTAAAAGPLAGCADDAGSSGSGRVLNVTTGSTGNFVRNFNPFSPEPLQPTHGWIYEPLFYFNMLDSSDIDAWLGETYEWSADGTTLTIKVRTNVTWSDGETFTAGDVAYTFGIMAGNDSLNTFGLPLESAKAQGDDTAVLRFSQSALTQEYFILGKQKIIPKHIWSGIPDRKKTTVRNENPVGTGPWTVESIEGMSMVLVARDDYYMQGLPHFDKMQFHSYSGNNSANAEIISGTIDWGSGYIANVEENYLSKDENYELVNIGIATCFFTPNTKKGPMADANVRHAVSAAIDRDLMNESVYAGTNSAASPTGLLLPNYEDVLDPDLADAEFDTGEDAVTDRLTSAGYARDSAGDWTRDGERLTITLSIVSGWTDYISMADMAKDQLGDVGIELKVETLSYNQWTDKRNKGEYDMVIDNAGYTPDPRSYYYDLLSTNVVKPVGESADRNFARYSNATVDDALQALGETTDTEEQLQHYYTIERQFRADMPYIPLFGAQCMMEFNGNTVTGYPTEDDPYASPANWLDPDGGWVAARVEPVE